VPLTRSRVDLSVHRTARDGATNSRNSRWIATIADHAKGGRWRNESMGCDNIVGSERHQLAVLTQPSA
jgi:hypothetical protein